MVRSRTGLWGWVVAAALLPSLPAASAQEEEVLLEDDFSQLDAGLANGEMVKVENNVLSINLTAEHWWDPLYQSMLFDNADATVKVRLQDPLGGIGETAGLVFWAANGDEFYVLQISDSGTFSVARATPDKWTNPIPWRASDVLKTEPGEWNELRVKTVGRRATIFVNGEEIGTIKGRPPEGGSLMGFYTSVGSEDSKGEFSEFKVVLPPDTAVAEEEDDPSVLYADDFQTLDPGWGSDMGWFGVKDGAMFVQLDPQQSFTPLYRADVFGDVDVSANFKSSVADGGLNCGRAIVFWATDSSTDFWIFELYDNKNIAIFRKSKDRWLKPMPPQQAPDEANIDLAAGVTLRVVTQGRRATVYVNGVECGTIQGQPPEGGAYVGLYGESDATAVTHTFSDFVVKQP